MIKETRRDCFSDLNIIYNIYKDMLNQVDILKRVSDILIYVCMCMCGVIRVILKNNVNCVYIPGCHLLPR